MALAMAKDRKMTISSSVPPGAVPYLGPLHSNTPLCNKCKDVFY